MAIFVITFLAMLVVVAAMAVGSIMANKPIKGSCGGLSALGMKTDCMICGGDQTAWRRETEIIGKADLGFDVMSEKPAAGA
ncbi:MAG: hypothetical protein ACI9WS_003311 [Paraglaciecola psychrophila]|jgi:hypothetical protein